VKPGDHVVLSGASCGHCPSCAADLPSYCRENLPRNFGALRMDGSSALRNGDERIHAHFFGQSSFSQFAIAQERTAVKVPRDLPLELLGPLGCGVITGTGAVMKSLALRAGECIVIFGAGGVGLSAVMAAKLVGAARIIAVDLLGTRLALARELGATHTVDAGGKADEMVAQIREFAGGAGADASLNTTSEPDVYTHAIACLGLRGRAGFVTAPRAPWQVPMMALMLGGRSLRGLVGGDAAPQTFIPLLIEYHRQGRLPFDRLVSYYPFEQIATAFEDMRRGAAIKPVLRIAA
jgi:aryl-alcohol dehydrogenase